MGHHTGVAPADDPVPEGEIVNILALILIIVAVVLLISWGIVPTLQFLLWIAIALAVIAVIVWLVRFITGRNTRA
jgi:hypothetical protein